MTLAELLEHYRQLRVAANAQMEQLFATIAEAGRGFSTEEETTHETLQAQITKLDGDITRVEARISAAATHAAPVVIGEPAIAARAAAPAAAAAAPTRSAPAVITARTVTDRFQGQTFARLAIARALSRETGMAVPDVLEARFGAQATRLARWLRNPANAANEVTGGTSATWLAELYDITGLQDFIEYLYSKTVVDKLDLRKVPPYVTFGGQDGASSGYWVGEGRAIPVTNLSLLTVSLTPLKVAAIAAISKETIRYAGPASERIVRDSLAEALIQRKDGTFFSSSAAVAAVSPAGVYNGVTPVASAGDDAAGVRADALQLLNTFVTAKNAGGLVWVMNPSMALTIGGMVNSFDQKVFPGLTIEGGTFMDLPVFVGDNVSSSYLTLVKPSDIYQVDDNSPAVEVSVSDTATIEMSSAPVANVGVPTGQTQNPVSMFQAESVAFKVVSPFNYAKRRAGAVAYVNDAAYGTPPTG